MTDIRPIEERLQYFVYVIESPSADDLYRSRGEGDMLRQAIGLNQIECTVRVTANLERFKTAISTGIEDAMKAFPNKYPILHISAHGNFDGIRLTSGEMIRWHELRELLIPINQQLSGSLIVCMSSCEGISGMRMAMNDKSDIEPYKILVGNSGKPTWSETAIAYATLYHLVANGHWIADSIEPMCRASGNNNFVGTTAEEARQKFIEHQTKKEP